MRKFGLVLGVFIAGVGVLVPSLAQAHFLLDAPTSWWSQASDGSPQKMAPCGDEATTGTSASKMVTTVQPGQSVPVQVTATVAHPGWYRISLKQGASSTQTATSFPDPPVLAGTACTPAFIDNPVWSPTQPVLADKQGLPSGSTSTTTTQSGMKTFNVTIPSTATCTSASPCTLQVLMFMTDHPAGSCNYHHCADIAFQTGSTGVGGHGGAAGSSGAGKGGAAGSPSGTAGTHGGGGVSGAAGGNGDAGATGGAPITGSGGSSGTGGTPGTGGTGSGGKIATGGTTGAAGAPAADASSGGCTYGVGGTSRGNLAMPILLTLAVAFARRRRSRRS